jgi:nicotinate phosphoribosyltransferase
MGSRRTDPHAAVAAARAAYIGGFASTSNLEAGRRYGVPTAGTAAHAFVLSFADESAAFRAQIDATGPGTTLLVDTFDTEAGIRRAIDVAGTGLAAVRIDSGDLAAWAARARGLLDSLGATGTRVVLTGDLDETTIRALASGPADAYGVGTSVVTGLGHPTAGFIYKLVAVDGRPVAKRSPGKSTIGGRKWAWRAGGGAEDVVALTAAAPPGGRALQTRLVRAGARVDRTTVEDARASHARSVAALGDRAALTVRFVPGGV